MNDSIPLGEAEGQKLEFKGKDALKHLANVSREVVAMLNSGGGEIWIGLGDEHARAVRIEPIENALREISRLRDHLSDAIEPSPIAGEIEIEPVGARDDGPVLRVSVIPSRHEPYALREGTARHFLKRVDDRLRVMTREELIQGFGLVRTRADTFHAKALEKLRLAQEVQRTKERMWLRIQPVGDIELKLDRSFQDYFSNPLKTGNRGAGWNFIDPYQRIKRGTDGSILFGEAEGIHVQIFPDGAVEFRMPIINLYWKTVGGPNQANGKEIWPYCLLEYPTSVFRLSSTIYREHNLISDRFLADLGLFGIKDWLLRPYSPQSIRFRLANPKKLDFDEIVLDEPANFTREQITGQPDRCAFRLVTQIYWRFDFDEQDMPAEFDQVAGRLVLPAA